MSSERVREFAFSDDNFKYICQFVLEHTGIVLTEAKKDMVYARLAKRVRKTSLESFNNFCAEIEKGNPEEVEFLINAITTNLTAFFREQHHFDYLASSVIPQLIQANASSKRIRIWSAGCSTGEEPYSLAITLLENIPNIATWDVKILATDLDANVVEAGKKGIYRKDRIETLPKDKLKKWFRQGAGAQEEMVKVHPQLQSLITFKRLNLLHDWPIRGPFDVIFCRNVVIYFDKTTQKELFDRFANLLAPKAHLFIGHSESLFKVTDRFIGLGKTIYRKKEE